MAEVTKRTIVIASILKPVNDARMTEKFGHTLAATRQYDVHIIGFPAEVAPTPLIQTHPLPFFKRLSFKRLFARLTVCKLFLKLKPDLIIFTTHELLTAAVLSKLITRCKIIYDVQENYYRNIKYTGAFPYLLRTFIAAGVRLKEIISSSFIDHFFLAESNYSKELNFLRLNFTVLENKLKKPAEKIARRNNPRRNNLLFSGTLSESTGVFKAIEIAVKLHPLNRNITLTIVGYCAQRNVLQKIVNTIEPYPFIRLLGGNQLVPHAEIIEQIKQADAGIISYPFNPSTYGSTPTKLYEYLGHQLPIILIHHPHWIALCEPFQAALVFEPEHINPKKLLEALNTQSFYTAEPLDVFWESEQPRLIRRVQQMLAP